MALNRDDILNELRNIKLPDGTDLPSSGLIQALAVESGAVRFVLEAKSPEDAANLAAVRDAAEAAVKAIAGVTSVSVVLTAHAPAAPPPNLKGAKRPAAPEGRQKIAGVNNIIAIVAMTNTNTPFKKVTFISNNSVLNRNKNGKRAVRIS